ncbi:MAG TPA: PrsW family glutamic-type intramembrane protease [Candidatus Paceibacterota bacterium]|nr:PrsW family glutamic-type intramembrane protease [Candidatus Paceibacterota bacterium]
MLSSALFIAFLGGIVPALLWLIFWLLEDRLHPEPKHYIILCFIAGMITVPFAGYIERAVCGSLSGGMCPLPNVSFFVLVCWAATEELLKFAAAYLVALRTRVFDEPLDAVIYMVTAALGFSAAENMLFLYSCLNLSPGSGCIAPTILSQAIITGDLRFMGAMLLHTLSSATIGLCLALAYYHGARSRRLAALGGLILATVLHTSFNFFILGSGSNATFWIFLVIWLGIIAVLLGIERVKRPMPHYS